MTVSMGSIIRAPAVAVFESERTRGAALSGRGGGGPAATPLLAAATVPVEVTEVSTGATVVVESGRNNRHHNYHHGHRDAIREAKKK